MGNDREDPPGVFCSEEAGQGQKKPVKATEFSYTRAAQLLPKIGPWRDELDGPLLVNEGKTPRERLTLCSPRLLRYTSGA